MSTTERLRTAVSETMWRFAPQLMHDRYLRRDKWAEIEEDLVPLIVDSSQASVDVGANLGRYTTILSRCSSSVYAFEPHHQVADLLVRLARRRGHDNVSVTQKAMSSSAEATRTFFVPVHGPGSAGTATLEAEVPNEAVEEHAVSTTTLDQLAGKGVGFVKIDVEGHERDVLYGSIELIAHDRPTFMVETEERHVPGAVAAVAQFFAARDYHGFFIWEGKTHDISEFDLARMQDPRELERPLPRRQMRYVNNFFFVADAEKSGRNRRTIDGYLNENGIVE